MSDELIKTLKSLGISEKDIAERICDNIATEYIHSYSIRGEVEKQLKDYQAKIIKEYIEAEMEKVTPIIINNLEGLRFNQTNKWGEPLSSGGEGGLTIREFIIKYIDEYLNTKVNDKGESKQECKGSSYDSSFIHQRKAFIIIQYLDQVLSKTYQTIMSDLSSKIKIEIAEVMTSRMEKISAMIDKDAHLRLNPPNKTKK